MKYELTDAKSSGGADAISASGIKLRVLINGGEIWIDGSHVHRAGLGHDSSSCQALLKAQTHQDSVN